MVKMPSFLTAAVATSARLAIALVATAFFSSHFVARASAMAPLVMALAAAFIMGAMAGIGCTMMMLSRCTKIGLLRQASGFGGIYNGSCHPPELGLCRCWASPAGCPTKNRQSNIGCIMASTQMLAFRAATGNALTIFFAGFALTMHILPKISFLPALVAGFMRVLMRHRPGMVKMPVFLTSAVATSARLAITLVATDFFSSHLVARASATAPLVMAVAFFMGAMAGIGCEVML